MSYPVRRLLIHTVVASARLRVFALFLALFGAAVGVVGAQPAQAPVEAQRALFRQAWAAAGRAQGFDDPAALRAYRLYPYLRARRLEARLDDPAQDAAVSSLLAELGDQPLSRALRGRWLNALAGRADWTRFRAAWVELPAPDPGLRCQHWNAMRALGATEEQAQSEGLAQWSAQAELPAACGALEPWLQARGALGVERVESLATRALEAGQASALRRLAALLPEPAAARWRRAGEALSAPEPSLRRFLGDPSWPCEAESVQQAYAAWARRAAQDALALLPALVARCARDLSAQPWQAARAEGQLRRSAALALAWSRMPEALEQFRRLPEELADARVQEWRLRSAFWAGDWAQALEWLQRLPPAMAAQPRWRYWRARSLAAVGQEGLATAQWAELALLRDYYGFLAADRVGSVYRLQHTPTTADPALQRALEGLPELLRARELLACALREPAAQEWAAALAGADAGRLRQAALLAHGWGWYEQSIATLAQAGEWNDLELRYPLPYGPEVLRASTRAGLPPAWVYAVMRQESLYRPDARSSADALGLLQLQPATARQIARRHKLPAPTRSALLEPATNLLLGAAYLRELYDEQQRLVLALAAYNAGPRAAARWRPAQAVDADVWIENIPYNETRSYLQRIAEHIVTLSWRLGTEPPRISDLLGPPLGPPSPRDTR